MTQDNLLQNQPERPPESQESDPFLLGSQTLADDVAYLGRLIAATLPICCIGVARLPHGGSIPELATWSEDGVDRTPAFRLLTDRFLDDLREMVQRDENLPSDEFLLSETKKALPAGDVGYPTLIRVQLHGELLGFALFSKRVGAGPWTSEEKKALEQRIAPLGITLASRNSHEDKQLHSFVLSSVMDSMQTNLFVTDIDTDEILFMNKTMKETFHLDHPEGKTCWKVLQRGQTGRCEFCPVPLLKSADSKSPSCVWEEENSITGCVYENYDSLMRWTDGSIVHFQQSIDISESKRLTRDASTDELTQLLNRRAGKQKLRERLAAAGKEGRAVTICMCDVNQLKAVNDTYGHSEGDVLLTMTAHAIARFLLSQEFAFRLSGDEFIIVFDVPPEEADRRIREMQHALEKEGRLHGKPYPAAFCYGLLSVPPGDDAPLNELLARADAKMYEQKRQFHRDILTQSQTDGLPVLPISFHYDKERLYDALVQSTDDYIYLCNMQTNIFRFPPSMLREFDLPGEFVYDATPIWTRLMHEEDRPAFLKAMRDMTEGRTDLHNVEYRVRNRRGEWVWLHCRGHLERDADGEPSLFAGIITDLGKKNRVDHLTGLFNKFELEKRVNTLLREDAVRSVVLVVFDLDDFKRINDLYNHDFGDEVLRMTAQNIQRILPGNAALYRLDGDEFSMIVWNMPDLELQKLLLSIKDLFAHQQSYDGRKYYCSLSAGCARYPEDADVYLDLLKYAEYSLEYAKSRGKNRTAFFSLDILRHKSRSLALLEALRESVESGFSGFYLCYQPQVDAQTGRLIGAEALARWNGRSFGSVPPTEFIPLLEESGLIIEAGKWIFQQAVRTCEKWTALLPDFSMSINLSRVQLTDPGFFPFVRSVLADCRITPDHIVVELTESYVASENETLRQAFDTLRGMGIRVAMDDFGTGYSSLEVLKNLPADLVKIDRAFVRDIQTSTFDATFIRFIVALCHDVKIAVCLEGVESTEEYDSVRPMQLDYIQGYLFGRPVPEQTFEETFLKQAAPGLPERADSEPCG